MKRMILAGVLALSVCMGLMAQAKKGAGPTPKSQKELEALQAMFNAPNSDARIKAAEEVLNKFADTEFKSVATYLLAASYDEKGDWEKTVFWAERTLQEDPKNFQSMLMLAVGIPKHSKEHDLDLDEKLTKSEKYAKSALDVLATAEKPNPNLTDEQWSNAKKDMIAQAHESYGIGAMLRKKYDVSITEFKLATEGVPDADPTTEIRLAQVYNLAGKPDDAISVLDKVAARPDLPVQLKQYAQAERVRAIQAKGGAKPPAATPAATPAPAAAPKN
jgi:tetratricopeptide (TPR) repeat protein